MPPLRFSLTDLAGAPFGSLADTTTGSIQIPLSDSRLAQSVRVSMEDPACAAIEAGSVVLKATYGDALVFNGVITVPSDDFAAGALTVAAMDPTLRAKHRNMRFGHVSVTNSLGAMPGIPIDGSGLRTILTDMDTGGGAIPKSGIQTGVDTVPAQPSFAAGGLYVKVLRGDQAWTLWQGMVSAAAGLDFELRPVDALHPGAAAWAAGALVELRTYAKQGVDRSHGNTLGNRPVVLVFGKDLSGLVYAPDAEHMVNYAVQVINGGQANAADVNAKAGAFDHSSWVKYGLFEDWQALGQQLEPGGELAVLKDRSLAVVTAYGTPPQYFTATCDTDTPGGLVYPRDFGGGDLITVVGKRGFRVVQVTGRVVQVNLRQKDANGNAVLEVLCVPHRTNPAGIAFDA